MKDKEELLLESTISDVMLELLHEQVTDDLYNTMTTSDLQGYAQVKAQRIIKTIKYEVIDCKHEKDFNDCMKRKGLL